MPERDPVSKITKEKWAGGITSAVEYLLCKLEVLSSNPRVTNTNEQINETK
jgi:hypothetical protein